MAGGRRRAAAVAALGAAAVLSLCAYGASKAYTKGFWAGVDWCADETARRMRDAARATSSSDGGDDDDDDDDDDARTRERRQRRARRDAAPRAETPGSVSDAVEIASPATASPSPSPSRASASKMKKKTAATSTGGPPPLPTPPPPRARPTPPAPPLAPARRSPVDIAAGYVAVYDDMRAAFDASGFDAIAATTSRRWFRFDPPPAVGVWPPPYVSLHLPKDCARLVAFTLEESPAVAAAAAAAAREVFSVLGKAGIPAFNVSRSSFHVSVFFLSLPEEPIDDPFTARIAGAAGSGTSSSFDLNSFEPDHEREEKTLEKTLRGVVDGGVIELEVDRVQVRSIQKCFTHPSVSTLDRVSFQLTGELFLYGTALQMASSGTLLLLFRDPAGGLAKLRAKLTETFPGATTRQTHIAHSTLLRAFPSAPEEEDGEREGGDGRRERARDAAARGVSAACERWSARIEGVKVRVNEAWFVREERFSSLDGARCSFRL